MRITDLPEIVPHKAYHTLVGTPASCIQLTALARGYSSGVALAHTA
jgi:hypothetical protein